MDRFAIRRLLALDTDTDRDLMPWEDEPIEEPDEPEPEPVPDVLTDEVPE